MLWQIASSYYAKFKTSMGIVESGKIIFLIGFLLKGAVNTNNFIVPQYLQQF